MAWTRNRRYSPEFIRWLYENGQLSRPIFQHRYYRMPWRINPAPQDEFDTVYDLFSREHGTMRRFK